MKPTQQGKGATRKPNTGAARRITAAPVTPHAIYADPLVQLASIALRVAQKKSAREALHAAA